MKEFISSLLPQSVKNIYHKYRAAKACKLNGYPSRKLKIIGVTGTDGKTSTATMLYEILKASGRKVGLVSTISARIGDEELPTGFHVTSPDPEDLQKFLKKMVDAGLEYVVLETTSHGLYQNRVYGVEYIAAIYTNITHEHLDHHKTYENYVKAKAKLLAQTNKETGFAVINHDDISYSHISPYVQKANLKCFTYGLSEKSDIYATEINEEVNKTEFTANFRGEEYRIWMKLPGRYNIYNALAAISTAIHLGVKPEDINTGLQSIKYIEGRWQVLLETPVKVVVDFAHTPNALYNVLQFAQEDNGRGRVIVVFGSAGLRDQTKRPLMGKSAGTFADIVILTAEDPRGEPIEAINRQIAVGLIELNKVENTDYFLINDRRKAIETAIEIARPGDSIIITGKGHEQSLNIDGVHELPWSDISITEEILNTNPNKFAGANV